MLEHLRSTRLTTKLRWIQDVPLEGAGWNKPLMQVFAAAAERVVKVLAGSGAEAVSRYGKSVHAKLGHGRLPAAWNSCILISHAGAIVT